MARPIRVIFSPDSNEVSVAATGSGGSAGSPSRDPHWNPPTSEERGLDASATRIVAAAVEILRQGEDLLCSLTAEAYSGRLPVAFNGSIGGHYRHCLDHFTSLLRGIDSDMVDYDHRERDPRIEGDPTFALSLTRRMRTLLERLDAEALRSPVLARCEVSYSHGDSPVTQSSLGRELVYAIAHSIHHFALIAVMARLMEVELPPHFGVAPSTVAHQKATAGH